MTVVHYLYVTSEANCPATRESYNENPSLNATIWHTATYCRADWLIRSACDSRIPVLHGRGDGRVPCGESKAGKDLANRIGRVDGAEYPHARATTGTGQNVDRKYTGHQLSPRVIPCMEGALPFGPRALGFLSLHCDLAARMRRRMRFSLGNNQAPEGCRWRKHSEIPRDVESGGRNERGEPLDQFHGLVDHMGRSVAPAVLEPIEKPAVGQRGLPAGRRHSGAWRLPGLNRERQSRREPEQLQPLSFASRFA